MDEDIRGKVDAVISDLVGEFLYYGRKECEYLTMDEINDFITDEDNVAWIVGRFAHYMQGENR